MLTHLRVGYPGEKFVLGVTAIASKHASFAHRQAVIDVYANDYGGCNEKIGVAEHDATLLVYFDPSQRTVKLQQKDTVTYLKSSRVFSSIRTPRL